MAKINGLNFLNCSKISKTFFLIYSWFFINSWRFSFGVFEFSSRLLHLFLQALHSRFLSLGRHFMHTIFPQLEKLNLTRRFSSRDTKQRLQWTQDIIYLIYRNWVFGTKSNIKTSISIELDVVNIWYFKLRLFDLTEFIVWII